jgi:hypothetical protein
MAWAVEMSIIKRITTNFENEREYFILLMIRKEDNLVLIDYSMLSPSLLGHPSAAVFSGSVFPYLRKQWTVGNR